MKHQLKILAAALAVVAAMPASAALIADGTTGDGNLFLTAWDSVAQRSYTLNLGITESAFTGTSNLSFTPDANMLTFLAGVTPANVNWNVVALDTTPNGVVTVGGNYNIFSTAAAAPTGSAAPGNSNLLNAGGTANTFIGAVNLLIPSSPGGNSIDHVSTGATDTAYALGGQFGANFGSKFAFSNTGVLDQSLNFYDFASTTGSNLTKATITPFAGQWDLASNGTLSFASTSAVPLPAAAWLFGSGLVGLVGVSRRKSVNV